MQTLKMLFVLWVAVINAHQMSVLERLTDLEHKLESPPTGTVTEADNLEAPEMPKDEEELGSDDVAEMFFKKKKCEDKAADYAKAKAAYNAAAAAFDVADAICCDAGYCRFKCKSYHANGICISHYDCWRAMEAKKAADNYNTNACDRGYQGACAAVAMATYGNFAANAIANKNDAAAKKMEALHHYNNMAWAVRCSSCSSGGLTHAQLSANLCLTDANKKACKCCKKRTASCT